MGEVGKALGIPSSETSDPTDIERKMLKWLRRVNKTRVSENIFKSKHEGRGEVGRPGLRLLKMQRMIY